MANKPGQARLPHGWIGRLFGRFMGWFNEDMEKTAIDRLLLQGSEKVLEIGFGSGIGIRYLVRKLSAGSVAGIDPSDIMLQQAMGRLTGQERKAVRLCSGTSARIPWPDQTFDAIVTVNNIQFWQLPGDLKEVKRALKPGGFVSVAVHGWAMREGYKVDAVQEALDRLKSAFEETGFLVHHYFIGKKGRTRDPIYLLAQRKQ